MTTDRIAQIERELAALKAKSNADLHPLRVPALTQFASEGLKQQELARLERVKVAEEAAERTRQQAKRDAPKQARRDAALKTIVDQIRATDAQHESEIRRLVGERIRLSRAPL